MTIAEASSLRDMECMMVEFMREFQYHYDNHMLPHFREEKPLDKDCKYCKVLLTPRNDNPNRPYLEDAQ